MRFLLIFGVLMLVSWVSMSVVWRVSDVSNPNTISITSSAEFPIEPIGKERIKKKIAQKKAKRAEQKEDYDYGLRTQLTAFLLCLFFGAFGIHRFYTGHILFGIIQLLTWGCCGVWTLVDLIIIMIGNMKTSRGNRLLSWKRQWH